MHYLECSLPKGWHLRSTSEGPQLWRKTADTAPFFQCGKDDAQTFDAHHSESPELAGTASAIRISWGVVRSPSSIKY